MSAAFTSELHGGNGENREGESRGFSFLFSVGSVHLVLSI